MHYLTEDELMAMHEVVIEETGGGQGVREPALLASIIEKPQAFFGGEELYPDIFIKAAVLYEALVNYHVFIDGNKRTGFTALTRFLHVNGYELCLVDQEIEDYTISVAVNNPSLGDVAAWIKQHSQKADS